jgi:predicted AAA+ superfamily ATPase
MADLLHGQATPLGKATLDLHAMIERIVTGGWPALLERRRFGSRWVQDYVEESTRIDLAEIGTSGRRRDPIKIGRVLRSIARSIGSAIRISTITEDTSGDEGGVSRDAVESYLEALRRVMLIEEVPAWQPHIRSATSLRTRPKLYFVDPSIGPATLQLSTDQLIRDLSYVGQLFENLVMRDVLVYAQANNAKVSYYRDDSGLEVDAIVEGENGHWIAMEFKLGSGSVDAAASSLHRFAERIDTVRMGTPRSLVIVTGSGYAFTRDDGIHVVPVELLGP